MMNHARRLAALLLCLLLAGCSSQTLDVPASTDVPASVSGNTPDSGPTVEFTREYYADLKPAEYLIHLKFTFATLAFRGDSSLKTEEYAADKPMHSPLDEPQLDDNGTYYVSHSEMPVFYGLLRETAQYLQDHGANYDDLAAPYHKAHALKAADVQAMVNTLLGKEVQLSLASADGAEYIEDAALFVYDELENPFQEFLDRGWTLEMTESVFDEDAPLDDWDETDGIPVTFNTLFWYDENTATVYDFTGEVLAHTHALDQLRADPVAGNYGMKVLDWCGLHPRGMGSEYAICGVDLQFEPGKTISLDTPISYVRCGNVGNCNLFVNGHAKIIPKQGGDGGVSLTKQLLAIESTFFDDYYRDASAGGKVTNYFIASFYERPEDVDITVLPTTDQEELARWCETYLGISVDDLTADPATVGTSECETPYVAFQQAYTDEDEQLAAKEGELIHLTYYNEIQRREAILTLCVVGDGYQFVSNVPDTTSY